MLFFILMFSCAEPESSLSVQLRDVELKPFVSLPQSVDCDLRSYFFAVDTPLPTKKQLLSLCENPQQQLWYYIEKSQQPRVSDMSYYLLGHFSEEPEIYARLLETLLAVETPLHIQRAILRALMIQGVQKQDLSRLDVLLDSDDPSLQYQVAKIYKRNQLYQPLIERFERLHPSVQRIVEKAPRSH